MYQIGEQIQAFFITSLTKDEKKLKEAKVFFENLDIMDFHDVDSDSFIVYTNFTNIEGFEFFFERDFTWKHINHGTQSIH